MRFRAVHFTLAVLLSEWLCRLHAASAPTITGNVTTSPIAITGNSTSPKTSISGNSTMSAITGNSVVADARWKALRELLEQPPASQPASDKRRELVRIDTKSSKIAHAREVSNAARSFGTDFPSDPKAPQARKIEALAALRGVDDDDRKQEVDALKLAANYRSDKAHHPRDRLEVAELAERVTTRGNRGGDAGGRNVIEDIKLVEKLRAEFGDMPEVFRLYASVARSADMRNAVRLADRIMASSAPNDIKAEAAAILSRQLLVGRRLNGKLVTLDGRTIDFEKGVKGPTVIYIWPHGMEDSLKGISPSKKLLPAEVEVLYFSPGTSASDLRARKVAAPTKGSFCYQPAGRDRPFVEQLRLQHAPYVFVLDGSGIVVGYGPARELPNLLPLLGK